MANTVETVWKIILDEKEAREGESTIQRLARLLKEKLGVEGAKAIDKTTEAIKDQTEALKKNEDAAKKAGDAKKGGLGDLAGGVGGGLGNVGRLAGAGSLVGAGDGLGIIGDIGDAIEGLQGLGSTLAQLGPAGALAGVAIVALGLVISDFAAAAQKEADAINAAIDSMRAVADEIAGGATKEDLQESIDQLQFRRELEKEILAESTQAYADFIQGIRDAFGVFAPLVEGIVKIVDPREEALKSQIEESNKLIGDSEAKERAYNNALEKGLTSKADAAKAEEERSKAAEKAARETEAAQKEAARTQEKAASEATRAVEQQAAKQEQAAQKQYQAAQKYGDAMVDIANKTADSAKAALDKQRQALADNQTGLQRDLISITEDFQASEREQQIERMEQEAADLRQHASKLNQIRDDAEAEEVDLLRQRDFLGATKVRERANAQIAQENKTLVEAQQEKIQLQREADAKELRELQDARLKRLTQFRQQNEDARQAYQRDLVAGREAKRIAERDAALARNRELKMASDTARAMLGIQSQFNQAQIQMAQNSLNQLRGVSNTTNNNNKTVNGGINFNMGGGAGGMSATQVQSTVLQVLGSVGLA